MIIVSACLAGIECNYKKEATPCKKVIDLIKKGKAIPVCPEQLGGLTTPRTPAEQKKGKVITKDGKDVTAQFKKGAKDALKIAKLAKCKIAIVRARSPSCGCGKVYDGTFTRTLIDGDGEWVKVLKKNKIKVITDEEYQFKIEF